MAANFDIHYLIMEDILSINQRPKMDEINTIIYCLLNMLYYNNETTTVEQEQIQFNFRKGLCAFVPYKMHVSDVFDPLREALEKLSILK